MDTGRTGRLGTQARSRAVPFTTTRIGAAMAAAAAAFAGSAVTAAYPLQALAQQAGSSSMPVTVKPEITVSATRTAREAGEVPATLSTKDAESIDRELIEDVRDLVRNEPGISVRRAPTRFGLALSSTGRAGNEGFNIRGLEGNRVLILVDGMRLPNAFSFGANSFGRGDYLDTTALGRVELLRGPASALYGSDGLAGAVSFFTPDPSDLLARSGGERHFGYRLGYDSSDRGLANTLSGAARFGALEAMALYTHREASELDNQGGNDAPDSRRTTPNPQDLKSDTLLAKLVYRLASGNRVRLTMEGQRSDLFTNGLAGVTPPPLAPPPAATSVVALTADDTIRRARASVDQSIGGLRSAFADDLRWAVYLQEAKNRQFAFEDRFTAADRVRDTSYEERSVGTNLEIDKRLAGALPQRLTYGVDASRTRYTNLRNGAVPPAGETFPAKAFPDTDYTLTGAFVQDEIALAGGAWFVIPALRYDSFELDPEPSALYPGVAAPSSDSAVTPKLALQWVPAAGWNLYTYVANGFRAPTPEQVNNGFTNPVMNYRSIGNPDLKPETSTTVEVGAKYAAGATRFAIAVFDGRYKDFIEQVQVGGSFTPADPALFQFVNRREVKVRGAEAGGQWSPFAGWLLSGAVAWAEGEDRTGGRPLNSVNPLQVVAGVQWQAQPALSTRLDVRHAAKKSAADIDQSAFAAPATQFAPPASTVFDLTAHWRIARRIALNAGVFNLTDRKYWHWTDVRGVASTSAQIDAFTQPGRYFTANLRVDF
jgi:hemoglobin/transferrin/lactoferrin receptor protein